MIRIQVRIKSRAFGITFGQFDETFHVDFGVPLPRLDKVLYDRRGVFVKVWA